MPHALIIGGTGLIGSTTARRLLAAGWHVKLTGREPAHLPAAFFAGKFDYEAEDEYLERRNAR